MTSTVSVEFDHLEFKYVEQFAGMDISGGPVLRDIHCQMHFGQRILLIGGNGAGKSTLLKMIGGKHLPTNGHCWQLGKRDSFRDTTLNLKRTMASSEWGNRSMAFASHSAAYAADIAVDEMMVKLQESFPERRQELLRCLRIDPTWRMHKLFLALLRPSQLIVLDEVLGCLDIISRVNLLEFLRRESDGPHRSTVVMASHVFDGMEEWVTHVMYLRSGKIAFFGGVDKVPLMGKSQLSIYHTTQVWLREEEEAPEKEASTSGVLENAQNRAGGFAAGRLGDYEQ